MRYPKLRELKEAIRALIKGPYTTKFPYIDYKPSDRYKGRPAPVDEWCVGCGACAEVCPAKAIEISDDIRKKERRIIWHYDICIFCGQCEINCLTQKGVKMSTEFDLATLDRSSSRGEQKKELVLCECCSEIIGTKEHLLWLSRKLGVLAHGNVNLLLISKRELKSIPAAEKEKSSIRGNFFRILCAKCRHQLYLKDEYNY